MKTKPLPVRTMRLSAREWGSLGKLARERKTSRGRIMAELIALGKSWPLFNGALRRAAEDAYQSDVLDTDMEDSIVGAAGSYATREDWIEDKMLEWLNGENEKAVKR